MKAGPKTLLALTLVAAAAGSSSPASAACTASAGTLDAARSVYATQCPSIPRVDCDPVAGAWTCSSERMTNGVPAASVVSTPVPAPTPAPAPTSVPVPVPTPASEPVARGGACEATGASLELAKSRYAAQCSAPRLDCDPDEGGWTCASYRIGLGTSLPTSAPVSTTTPAPAAAPATPVASTSPVPVSKARAGERDTSVVKLPVRLENLYKYNVAAITNMWTATFPGGVPTQLVTFYDERKRVHIASRAFPHGEFGAPIDIDRQVQPGDTLEPDSHNTTGVAVAPDGTVFVTANHHVDELNLARTTRPYDLTSFVNVPASELGRGLVERITYPSFFKLGGYLWLSAREQDIGRGTNFFNWRLWRYDHDSGRWDIRTKLNGGQRLRLYVSNVDWSADESEIHLIGVWREEWERTGLDRNMDLFHLRSRDGRTFEHVDGTPAPLPLVWSKNHNRATADDHEVPVLLWDTSAGDPQPYQPGSVIFDGAGAPHVLTKEMANGGRATWHHRWDASRGSWVSRKTGMATHTDDLVKLPDGRVGMIGHVKDAIYFLDLSTPGAARVLLAKGFHTRDFVINVGKTEMRQGYLSIWLMENGHALPGRLSGARPTDAWVLTIGLDELRDFDRPVIR